MQTETSSEPQIQASLSVQIPGGEYITRQLRTGERLAVGSSDTSELRLDSPGVAAMHCLISIEAGAVHVKDCYSPTGTFVNDYSIRSLNVTDDCQIRVGENIIHLTLRNSRPQEYPQSCLRTSQLASEVSPPVPSRLGINAEALIRELTAERPGTTGSEFLNHDTSETTSEVEEMAAPESRDGVLRSQPPLPSSGLFSDTPVNLPELQQALAELEQAHAEIEVLQERLETVSYNSRQAFETYHQETIDLLREEVLTLQAELSRTQQNQGATQPTGRSTAFTGQPVDYEANGSPWNPPEEMHDPVEVERLVERLETLLHELQSKDENIQLLQDLVLAAESANQAEQEEREHLSRWLSEFESRFDLIADEWSAEKTVLLQKIGQLEYQRDEAQQALSAKSSQTQIEALHRLNQSFRQQIQERDSELERYRAEQAVLKAKLHQAEQNTSPEQEVQLARERARLARLQHELEVKKQKLHANELNSEPKAPENHLSDLKIREFREEMRGASKTSTASSSLSARLASLWGRLNS